MLTTNPGAFMFQGGGEREILLLREALTESGYIADIYGSNSIDVSEYDFAIHTSLGGGSEYLILPLVDAGIPLILWPNLWFVTPPTSEHLAHMAYLLSYFKAVVFRSRAEEAHFRQFFDLEGKSVIQVSFLLSHHFLRSGVSDVFRESYGFSRYAIWPGIIEPQKNQLAAVRAFNELDIDLIISGRVRDQDYLMRCRSEAGSNIHFIPSMPFGSELHLSALAYSDLYVELPFDFPGSSAIEAAAMGCQMVLSRGAWVQELLADQCVQVDPSDIDEIRLSINNLLKRNKITPRASLPMDLKNAIQPLASYIDSY
ncbi:hypothetical protein [Rhodoferax sp. GW822-FHT02A01]|uniref:hypothetical protein n=1 Tax=Rhodoferax sp. GW822-FHT02A01 TaxID=3141537 RepID=UPI00315CCC35